MKNILPNVVIGGAPKCGTSSLFFWLSAHPEVCGSRVKETFYFNDTINPNFNSKANFISHGLTKYSQFWSHYENEKILIEASAPYLYQKNALEQLSLFSTKPKLIFILREPAARTYSLFKFNKYRLGYYDEDFTFKDFVNRQLSIKDRRSQLDESFYFQYIIKWIEKFGKENILVYQFEKLQKDKVAFMKQVAIDLSIDESFYDGFDFFKRNETRSMKNHKLHRLGLKIQPYVPQWLQEKVFVPFYLFLNSTKAPGVTVEEKKYLEQLKEEFKESNKLLAEKYPQIDLSLWN